MLNYLCTTIVFHHQHNIEIYYVESTTDSSPINFSKLQQPSGNASDEQQQLLREKVSKNWRVRKRWRLSQAILFTKGKNNDQLKKASNTTKIFSYLSSPLHCWFFLVIRQSNSCNWERFQPYLRQWKFWLSVFMSFFGTGIYFSLYVKLLCPPRQASAAAHLNSPPLSKHTQIIIIASSKCSQSCNKSYKNDTI